MSEQLEGRTLLSVTPTFSGLTSPIITYGTNTATFSGTITAGSLIPTGSILVSLGGVTWTVGTSINASTGAFSVGFDAHFLKATSSPYVVTYSYPGNGSFLPISDSSQTLTVNPASLSVAWPNPSAILSGTPLGSAQLNATANGVGTFTYSPSIGTVLPLGKNTVQVTFAPNDPSDYTTPSTTLVDSIQIAPTEKQIVVNSTADEPETNATTLRQAIDAANASTEPTVIAFDPAVFATEQTIDLNEVLELTNISNLITVHGPSAGLLLQGNGPAEAFQVDQGVTADIENLTVSSFNDAAILNKGNLNLDNVTVSDNISTQAWGAGIANDGTMNAINLSVFGNTTSATYGAGIYNFGTMTLQSSAVYDNSITGYSGAGIANNGGTMTLIDDTVAGNSSTGTGYGGGIYNSGQMTLDNDTISSNSATTLGGGIFNDFNGVITLANTIVAGNTSSFEPDVFSPFIAGAYTLFSQGNNLIGVGADDATPTGWVSSDAVGTAAVPLAAMLSPLGNYGGPTLTMPPLAGSPAIETGSVALIPSGVVTDQRGQPRTVNGSVDVGAAQTGSQNSTTLSLVQGQGIFDDSASLEATLMGNGVPLAGEQISFVLNGTPVGIATTNTNGTAVLVDVDVSGFGVGTYGSVVTASFVGDSSFDSNYLPSNGIGALTVGQATPVITWPTPADISYGTALSAAQLSAAASVSGSITYTPAVGTVLPVGLNALSATFIPSDATDYQSVTQSVEINVIGNGATAIQGFNNGAGWTENEIDENNLVWFVNDQPVPAETENTLQITNPHLQEAASTFYNQPVDVVDPFTVSFVYQRIGGTATPADGIALVLQNDPRGANALGQSGSGLAYGQEQSGGTGASIANSVALELNVYSPYGIGAGWAVNGYSYGTSHYGTPSLYYPSVAPVDLANDPVRVTFSYDGVGISIYTFTDLVTGGTSTQRWSNYLPHYVGSDTAFLGFTGSTGARDSNQYITDFSFSSTVRESSNASVATATGAGSSTTTLSARLTTGPSPAIQTPANNFVYLSSVPWASATVGFGSIHENRDIMGNNISLRGQVYPTGIGTHAVSQIVYNLGGQYAAFISDVGLDDDSVNTVGAVDFQVIGDGTVLFDSGVLTGASPIVHVNVSLAGVQQLTLQVTNGIPGITSDHADWAGAELVYLPSTNSPPAGVGMALANEPVTFSLNGTPVGTVMTDANGVATLSGVSVNGIPAGTYANAITASFGGDANYAASAGTGALTKNQTAPVVTWPTPANISFGTPISATQLNATANVAGSFHYSPIAGTILPVGTNMLQVTFVPTDSVDYTSVTQTIDLNVLGNATGPTVYQGAIVRTSGRGQPLAFSQRISISVAPGAHTLTLANLPSGVTLLSAGIYALGTTLGAQVTSVSANSILFTVPPSNDSENSIITLNLMFSDPQNLVFNSYSYGLT